MPWRTTTHKNNIVTILTTSIVIRITILTRESIRVTFYGNLIEPRVSLPVNVVSYLSQY